MASSDRPNKKMYYSSKFVWKWLEKTLLVGRVWLPSYNDDSV